MCCMSMTEPRCDSSNNNVFHLIATSAVHVIDNRPIGDRSAAAALLKIVLQEVTGDHVTAMVNVTNQSGISPLGLHTEYNLMPSVELLLDAGALVDLPTGDKGDTPLMVAARKGWHKLVARLIEAGKCQWLTPNLHLLFMLLLLSFLLKTSSIHSQTLCFKQVLMSTSAMQTIRQHFTSCLTLGPSPASVARDTLSACTICLMLEPK